MQGKPIEEAASIARRFPSFNFADKVIPELIKRGYDLVTVSELAKRKGVTLEAKTYSSIR